MNGDINDLQSDEKKSERSNEQPQSVIYLCRIEICVVLSAF